MENNDASKIEFKQFNKSPKDKYPTFTFCLEDDPKVIYKKELAELLVSEEEYSNILKGVSSSTKKSLDTSNRVVDVELDSFTIQKQNLISKVKFLAKSQKDTLSYNAEEIAAENDKLDKMKSFLYKNHQDPDKICFTRNTRLEANNSSIRKRDEITFDIAPFNDLFETSGGYFRVYVHYPGQFTRSMDEPVLELALIELPRRITGISLTIPYVSVLRKRHKPHTPCNGSLEDDDNKFKMMIVDQVKCVPIYWKHLIIDDISLDLCKTSTELEEVYGLQKLPIAIMKKYDPPCIEMQTPVSVQHTTNFNNNYKSRFILSFLYTTETFQEIDNVIDFDFETLWSSVGGFIGIFLGYSLLQVPELLVIDWSRHWQELRIFWRKITCHRP